MCSPVSGSPPRRGAGRRAPPAGGSALDAGASRRREPGLGCAVGFGCHRLACLHQQWSVCRRRGLPCLAPDGRRGQLRPLDRAGDDARIAEHGPPQVLERSPRGAVGGNAGGGGRDHRPCLVPRGGAELDRRAGDVHHFRHRYPRGCPGRGRQPFARGQRRSRRSRVGVARFAFKGRQGSPAGKRARWAR